MDEVNIANDLLKKVFVAAKNRLITVTNEEYDAVLTEIGAYLYDINITGTNPALAIEAFIRNPIGFNKEEVAATVGIDLQGNKLKVYGDT